MKQDEYICRCMSIDYQSIFLAAKRGIRDLDDLIDWTGAAKGCGTCINALNAKLEKAINSCNITDTQQNKFPFA